MGQRVSEYEAEARAVAQMLDREYETNRTLRHALAAKDAEITALRERVGVLEVDKARLDWLEMQVVNVRDLLPYGSRDLFWATPEGGWEDEVTASDLRKKIDAALTTQGGKAPPKEPHNV